MVGSRFDVLNVEEIEDNSKGICDEVAALEDQLKHIPGPDIHVTFTGSTSASNEPSGSRKKLGIRPKKKTPIQIQFKPKPQPITLLGLVD